MRAKLEWFLIAVLAVVSCALVVKVAPDREPFPPGNPVPSARTVERQAERAARSFGVDLGSWARVLRTNRERTLRLAFEGGLVDPHWQLRRPSTYRVDFFGPNRQRCIVEIDLEGNLVEFELRRPGLQTADVYRGSAAQANLSRETALAAYAAFWESRPVAALGTDFAFRPTAEAVPESDGYVFEWTSQPDSAGLLAWKLRLVVREGFVVRFAIEPLPLETLREQERSIDERFELAFVAILITGVLAILVAAGFMVVNLYLGRLPWNFVLRAGAFLTFLLVVDIVGGSRLSQLQLAWYTNLQDAIPLAVVGLLNLCMALAVVSAGRAIRVSADFRRWLGLEDFLLLQWNKASVTRSFLSAFLVGPIWLGISYAILALSTGGLAETLTLQASVLHLPPYEGIYAARGIALMVILFFGIPLVRSYVPNRNLQGALAIIVAAMGSVISSLVEYPISLLFLEALLHGALLVYAYRRFGVLAAVLGAVLAEPLGRAFVFFERGELVPQAWGVAMLVIGGLFFGVCLLLDLRNPNREEEQRLSEEEFEALKRESERKLVTRRERLLGEFALAQQAQQRMLPDFPPAIPGFEVAAVCVPALQVGGDLFDYMQISDSRWTFCVADVSGKGVSAALYMTMVKGLLSAMRLKRADLREIVAALNEHIYRVIEKRSFVTMMLAALDPQSRKLEVLRAGHPPLLHARSDGSFSFLESNGMGLGLAPSAIFCRRLSTATVSLAPGDVAVLYSDGVTEAMNRKREEFGEDRLVSVVEASVSAKADDICQEILHAIQTFQDGAPVHDDITVMVLKVASG